ncbi:MAG: Uncharacterized protein XE05_0604 [Thermotogales bacterium 46_20]|nr:MAG: Uncharacterized protein XE05_0604 [Thermotogales bacterium 46_20]
MFDHRISVMMGMFGSGKTELSLNLASYLKESCEAVALIDADVISPYFRSRDLVDLFADNDIDIIAPKGPLRTADLPIVPARVRGVIQSEDTIVVIDAGGNEYGAVVLSSISADIKSQESAVYFVVNPFRPFTDTVAKTVDHLVSLSKRARLTVNYLVNNANLGSETTEDDVLSGEQFLKEVSDETGIPVIMTCVMNGIEVLNNRFPVFQMKKYLKTPWEV